MKRKAQAKAHWSDRVASVLSPRWALRRMDARRRLDFMARDARRQRDFDTVNGGRVRNDILSTNKSMDSLVASNAKSLREQVRRLELNTGFVGGPIKRCVRNIVGSGIRYQARAKASTRGVIPGVTEAQAQQFNADAEAGWRRWSKQADKRLICTFEEIQALVEACLWRDGEAILIGRQSARTDRFVPYCLEVLEIDRLGTPMSEVNNPKIRNGIEVDDEGAPLAYWILRDHPGESFMSGLSRNDFDRVPAWENGRRKVIHLFNPIRPEQMRGLTEFAAGLKGLHDADRYKDAELFAALADACLTGIVKSRNPDDTNSNWTSDDTTAEDGGGSTRRIHEFGIGEIWYLNDDEEEATIHSPTRPNTAFETMMRHMLSDPSNALDIPPEIMGQNWQGMNYSNARTVLLQFYLMCRIRQSYLVAHLCQPVLENVMREFVIRGVVKAPTWDRDPEAWLAASWIPPGWAWVDPLKEAQATATELAEGTETFPRVWAAKGEDWEEQLEIQALVLQKKAQLEEQYGVKFPTKSAAAPIAQDDEEDEEEEPRAIRRVK